MFGLHQLQDAVADIEAGRAVDAFRENQLRLRSMLGRAMLLSAHEAALARPPADAQKRHRRARELQLPLRPARPKLAHAYRPYPSALALLAMRQLRDVSTDGSPSPSPPPQSISDSDAGSTTSTENMSAPGADSGYEFEHVPRPEPVEYILLEPGSIPGKDLYPERYKYAV